MQNAISMYEKAIELGSVFAMYNMGNVYAFGRGVKVNNTLAVKYYKMAAEQGNPEFSLLLLYTI